MNKQFTDFSKTKKEANYQCIPTKIALSLDVNIQVGKNQQAQE